MPAPIGPDTAQKQQMFLDALREAGTLRKSAELAHVGRSTVAQWRADNVNGFRARFDEALDDFADKLEAKMFELLGEMRVGHNPTLLIFALKALRPIKYRELTQIPDEHARTLLKRLEEFAPKVVAAPESADAAQLSPMEQVEQLLKRAGSA